MKKLVAIACLFVSACAPATVHVINRAPAPWFPSCATIKDALRADAPDAVWKDWVHVDNVMRKLREAQDNGDRESFGTCSMAGFKPSATTFLSMRSPLHILGVGTRANP